MMKPSRTYMGYLLNGLYACEDAKYAVMVAPDQMCRGKQYAPSNFQMELCQKYRTFALEGVQTVGQHECN